MTRVFILAPTPMMQAGLHSLLTHPDLQIVGTAQTPEALSASSENPDVVIMADAEQLRNVGQMLALFPQLALVVLADNTEQVVSTLQTLELHGWGIVPLNAPAVQLQAAVVSAAQGLVALPHAFASTLTPERHGAATFERVILEGTTDESLTPREREVLELVSQGLSNKLIARRLHISEHTVKFHISSITGKLGASSRTDAVSQGLRRGLITL
jgi:DNA-binding NarL/FixJ family response regulator